MPEPENLHPAQEPDTVSWKAIVTVAVATIGLSIGLSYCARYVVNERDEALRGTRLTTEEHPAPAGNQLEHGLFESYAPGAGERQRQAERERLQSWGWVDRERQTVHMPIDLAIEQVLANQEGR